REHRRTLHRSAVVRVEHPPDEVDVGSSLDASALDQSGREIGGLDVVNLPAEDLTAPHVLDEVQVEELAAHQAAKVGDVPRGDLPRCVGDVLVWACRRQSCATTARVNEFETAVA